MKKLYLVILFLSFTLLFTACDPAMGPFDDFDSSDNIESIELIYYENPTQRSFLSWIPDYTPQLQDLDMSNITVLETLDTNLIDDFVSQFNEAELLYKYFTFDSPKGICIRMNYENGDFEIINCETNTFAGYIGKYTSDGEVIDFLASFSAYEDFEYLVTDFFETSLE